MQETGPMVYNRRKIARLIKQYRDIFSNISEGTAFLLQGRMTLVLNVTSLKYGKRDMTSKKRNNNKRLIDKTK